MLKLLWPLLIVILRIPGLIWRGTAYFVQNDTTIILLHDTPRAASELPCRKTATHFGAILEAWKQKKNVSYFSLFIIDLIFGIVNPFPWKANTISSEKSCLISMPFLLTYIDVSTVKFSHLLNPDWSIQIFRTPAVWKEERIT